MKRLLFILMIMTTTKLMAQDGKATTIKKTFSRSTAVSVLINSDVSIIWALLNNAADFPRWNSTILSIEGEIKEGEKIRLKSYLDPKRTFKIKIKEVVVDEKMVWGDAIGTRVYTLEKTENNMVLFTMDEKIKSPMFPLFASKIPDFDESFEKFAADLKKEAEIIANKVK